ncbi:hypothetical protein WA158_002035 [Blastocystis sp. Blastoise]
MKYKSHGILKEVPVHSTFYVFVHSLYIPDNLSILQDIITAFQDLFTPPSSITQTSPCSLIQSNTTIKEMSNPVIQGVHIYIDTPEGLSLSSFPSLDMEESYLLYLTSPYIYIHTHSIYGVIRSFSSLYQLIQPSRSISLYFPSKQYIEKSTLTLQSEMNHLYSIISHIPNIQFNYSSFPFVSLPNSPFGISCLIYDYPHYLWRGLSLDTNRHFQSLLAIQKIITGMYIEKSNVLHWHMFDGAQFNIQFFKDNIPLKPSSTPRVLQKTVLFPSQERDFLLPNMQCGILPEYISNDKQSERSIYSHVYNEIDILNIINYARVRGIRVIPELDLPGHTGGISRCFPKTAAQCGQETNNRDYSMENKYMIHPFKNETFSLITFILDKLISLFPDRYVHLGGDEVSYTCWKSDPNLKTKNYYEYKEYTANFISYFVNYTVSRGKQAILWEEAIDYPYVTPLPRGTLFQIWRCWGGSIRVGETSAVSIIKMGYRIINSLCTYLDWTSSLQELYAYEPSSLNLNFYSSLSPPPLYPNITFKYIYPSKQSKKSFLPYILGGEAALWTEQMDTSNILCRTFPRLSALNQLYWTQEYINFTTLYPYIGIHSLLLHRSSIPVAPLHPLYPLATITPLVTLYNHEKTRDYPSTKEDPAWREGYQGYTNTIPSLSYADQCPRLPEHDTHAYHKHSIFIYNINGFSSMSANNLSSLLLEYKPTFFLLNEVPSMESQQEFFSYIETSGYPYYFHSHGDYPLFIGSISPIYIYKQSLYSSRSILHISTQGIHFFCIHLNPHRVESRESEVSSVMADIINLSSLTPIVVLGDMNSIPNTFKKCIQSQTEILKKYVKTTLYNKLVYNQTIYTKTMDLFLNNGFTDIISRGNKKCLYTQPTNKGYDQAPNQSLLKLRVTQLFMNDAAKQIYGIPSCNVVENILTRNYSDHFPLFCKFSESIKEMNR